MKSHVVIVDPPGQSGYLPLAGAYLIANARANNDVRQSFNFHLATEAALTNLDSAMSSALSAGVPDIIAFSCQGWSVNRADAMAQKIKVAYPSTFIIYGGNHVSGQADTLFAERPFLDLLVSGEGELVFPEILRAWKADPSNPNFTSIPGCSWRVQDGEWHTGIPVERIADIDLLPSPYLSGTLNENLRSNHVVLLETNRGCPYKCSFCYWGGAIQSKVRRFSLPRIFREMQFLANNNIESWYICDANFGILKRDSEIVEEIVRLRRMFGVPRVVHTNWAKHSNHKMVSLVKRLNDCGVHSTFTIALQTSDPTALKLANRTNMQINKLEELSTLCRQNGIIPRGELIWGLPGETYERFLESYNDLSGLTDALTVYPHYILPNTEFSQRREELGIRVQRGEIDTAYEYCIAHNSMSHDDFLKGMRFIIANNVLKVGGNIFVIYPRILKKVANVSQSQLIAQFGVWVMQSNHPVAKELSVYFQKPLLVHRHSFAAIWEQIRNNRDAFLDMVAKYVDEVFHRNFDSDKSELLRQAMQYDCALFPVMDDHFADREHSSEYYEQEAIFNYDFLAIQQGSKDLPERAEFTYRIMLPKGLSNSNSDQWYFSFLSYRGKAFATD